MSDPSPAPGSVRRFTAERIEDAVKLARREFGGDAVILSTRTVTRRDGFLRMRARQLWEVYACPESAVPVRTRLPRSRGAPRAADKVRRGYAAGAGNPDRAAATAVAATSPAVPLRTTDTAEIASMKEMLRKLTAKIEEMPHRLGTRAEALFPEVLQREYERLVEVGVAAATARELLAKVNEGLTGDGLRDPAVVRHALREAIAGRIRTGGPIRVRKGERRIVALVGPTGVGKTTTIAKIAAYYHLREHASVAMVTIDTYRMAAAEQIRQYAGIMDVPFYKALTPNDLRETVRSLEGTDLVLLDTAGRGQRDRIRLNEIRTFLDAASPQETHLVLSLTSHPRTLRGVAEFYGAFSPERILLTKLDECMSPGTVLDAIESLDVPLSYVTTGQDVPDDLEVGRPSRIAKFVLGEEPV